VVYMAGTIDGSLILLRLVYIRVACSMFEHVFFLIHMFKNSAGDGARWHKMQIWMMFLCLLISLFFYFLKCMTRQSSFE
jgi:hypothetical protein